MPLPPALAARLAQRGLLDNNASKYGITSNPKIHLDNKEEVIAEYYDDPAEEKEVLSTPRDSTVSTAKLSRLQRFGHSSCPNRTNIYHTCSNYCINRWSKGILVPNQAYNKKRIRMIKKYPLQSPWKEIYDSGIGRYYYWNSETNDVSWLSPSHPKAKFLRPASELRANLISTKSLESNENNSSLDDSTNLSKGRGANKGERKKRDDLDPMDPAAYSDIPRGDWNAGLERSELVGGVDSTAVGSLFQMRPYPSPGAVLSGNRAERRTKKIKTQK